MEQNEIKIPKRILSTLMNSLLAGVVPRIGCSYIAIGRTEEITAMSNVLDRASEGSSGLKFIIGRYGSGKSFLINLMSSNAMERGFIVAGCDLTPERRLSGTNNVGLATYRALISGLSTKACPEGGALSAIISRWLSNLQSEVAASGLTPDNPKFEREVSSKIYTIARELESEVGGFDFARVIVGFYEAEKSGDEEKKSNCLRWLRGEYTTRTEAKRDLGVGLIIDDDSWYEYIKIFALLSRKIGYCGMAVFIDECVNLYKITNRISRENNYEKLLSIVNDNLQGRSPGLAIFFGGTPQFLEDTRRGLFSYEALRSRLSDSRFVTDEKYKNMMGPVIKLRMMAPAQTLALLYRISILYEQYHDIKTPLLTNEQKQTFLTLILSKIGSETNITPREIIREYLSLLGILLQNPESSFESVVGLSIESIKSQSGQDPDNELFADIEI